MIQIQLDHLNLIQCFEVNMIGICGKKRSGKDTVAKMLQELSPDYQIRAFADAVKELCIYGTGLKREMFYSENKDTTQISLSVEQIMNLALAIQELGEHHDIELNADQFCLLSRECFDTLYHTITIRQLLQYVGTDICQKWLGYDIWIKETIEHDYLILSDARFQRERDAIRKRNGIIILVERKDDIKDWHISENELQDDYDYVINNDGSLNDLKVKVREICLDMKLI